MITIDDIRDAVRRLDGVAHRTPVLRSRTLDSLLGAHVYLKAENLQRGGAFKFRGAYNRIAAIPPEERAHGVAAFSSGNHAQAVALAARELGTTAVIVMPEDTPATKLAATREYGAEVVTYDRYSGDREALGDQLAAERGITLVPPYDHPLVMAGQGTAALELFDQVEMPLDAIAVPVGGGGLIAGCGTAAKAVYPRIRVIGVEPKTGDDTRRSLKAGKRVRIKVPRTIADGQQVDTPGKLTFEVNREVVDEVVVVTDEEITAAMVFLFERLKTVAEPSGASALAALMAGAIDDVAGRHIGVIISGGNVGAERFRDLLSGGAVP